MIFTVVAIFVLSYGLLIFRRIRGRQVPLWISMVVGAGLMIATLSISPLEALYAIDLRVISFLFGMLVITAGFEKSGLIEYMVLWIMRRARSVDRLLIAIIFVAGLISAVLVNDAIALLWTPVVLGFASRIGARQNKVLLTPLAFGLTVGSGLTPVGNPQNLLVALNSGMDAPFVQFVSRMAMPTVASLLCVYVICRFFYRKEYALLRRAMAGPPMVESPASAITDRLLARTSAGSLVALIISFVISEAVPSLQSAGLTLSTLAPLFGVALLVLSPRRLELVRSISWSVLIFFAGMFVLMKAVWNSGVGPSMLSVLPAPTQQNRPQAIGAIMLDSVLLSQILSNVPFVQLYSYQMNSLGFGSKAVLPWLALAAGSTLAGNLTLLGAVSNIIIVDAAENRKKMAFSFLEFFKIGVIVTTVTCLIFFFALAFL